MSILVLTSDTLSSPAAAGQIEYNGQFFGTDSNASRAQMQRITLGTAQASTSGTSIDFTGIPSWVKRITVMFNGVSTNGTANIIIQIGSGSVTTSGYSFGASFVANANTTGAGTGTNAIVALVGGAANSTYYGQAVLTLISGNVWIGTFTGSDPVNNRTQSSSGFVSLSGTLDRVRITTGNGTDTFDAGSINILYGG